MPIFGAPSVSFPKMKMMHRTMFSAFITTAETRCTCVLPMPSKNALNANVVAIDVTPRKRHLRYACAARRAAGTVPSAGPGMITLSTDGMSR